MSVNKAILVGNVGKDPEIRSMQSGDTVGSFSVATSESWKDKSSGERKEKTEWHRISCFNQGLNKIIQSYVKKGSKIYIEGQIETRKWTDKDGVEKYSTEIVLRPFRGDIVLLGDKKDEENTSQAKEPPKTRLQQKEEFEDEIPF